MIELPKFENKWDYINGFYLTSPNRELVKILSYWELYEKISDTPGDIIDCGIFKGSSLIRFATYRNMINMPFARQIVGFDTFGKFPETDYENDKQKREQFVEQAGEESLNTEQIRQVLNQKNLNRNIELVEGDINNTVPEFIDSNPNIRIALLHIDVDIYEPTVTIMESLYDHVVDGGIVIIDNYGDFDGESTAVENHLGTSEDIRPMPYGVGGAYIVK